MSIAESMLPEFEHEMANTRKVLALVPDDKLDWKAGPTFNTIGWVSSHLADIPSWGEGTLTYDSFDVNPAGGEPYQTPMAGSRQQILEMFDTNVAAAKKAIAAANDEAFFKPWSLKAAGEALFTMPRVAVLRGFVINHAIHHRAHLCVYLRLNGIEVPQMYGA